MKAWIGAKQHDPISYAILDTKSSHQFSEDGRGECTRGIRGTSPVTLRTAFKQLQKRNKIYFSNINSGILQSIHSPVAQNSLIFQNHPVIHRQWIKPPAFEILLNVASTQSTDGLADHFGMTICMGNYCEKGLFVAETNPYFVFLLMG